MRALGLLFWIAVAQAQNAPPQPAVLIRSDAKEVLVPVVVTNGRGQHITGLQASDFQVFEDGKLERIVAFHTERMAVPGLAPEGAAQPRTRTSNAPATAAAGPVDPRETYLIVVDTLHSAFANFARIRDALQKFFEKEHGADAQYALIALGRSPVVVQDSTRDPAQVLAAVRSERFSKTIFASEAANLATAADEFSALVRAYCVYCACVITGNNAELPQCPDTKGRVRAFLTSFGERTFLLNQQFLSEMRNIVNAIATMPTSRTVVFISDGFNRFSGRELYAILAGYGPLDHSFEFEHRDTQPGLDAVLKIATANDVKFYTIDSRGLYTVAAVPGSGFDASSTSHMQTQMDGRRSPNISAGVPEAVTSNTVSAARESTDALSRLARETGGTFYENNNDLLKGIRQAVVDGREYYVLSYVPDGTAPDGKYRKIQVTVKRSGWLVHAKAGYWSLER